MAKRCPNCGAMNDDEMVFCGVCTEPLNDDVKLVMRVEEMAKEMKDHSSNRPMKEEWEREHSKDHAPTGARTVQDEEATQIHIQKKEEKEGGGALPMILLGIVAAVAVVFLLK